MFINKIQYRSKKVALLTTLMGQLYAFDLQEDKIVGYVKLQSAVNCLGSLQRSSGFNLGVTLLQIGNFTTPALSDNKCVLYAVNLPCLLRSLFPLPELSQMMPLLDQVIDTAVENLSATRVNSLDLDILINGDERVTSATYVTLLTAIC